MRLRHIEVFHAIYTTGSITAAAKLLHVSQPSVSKVLSHAEMQLGFLLFNRVKGRLTPTNEANLLFEEVDRVYQQMNTIKSAAENIKNNETGRIALALSPALGFDIIPDAVSSYKTGHTKVKFDLQTLHNEQVQKHLFRHKSELAVMFAPKQHAGLQNIDFGIGKMVAVYPKLWFPDLPKRISLKTLLKHSLIGIKGSGPLADLVWAEINRQKIDVKTQLQVQTYFLAVQLAARELGVCLVDEFTANGCRSNAMGIAELKENLSFPIQGLHIESKPLSRPMTRFVKHLQTFLADKIRVP